MGVAVGVAVALARSAPPVPDTPLAEPTPAEVAHAATPRPDPLTGAAWFTTWRPDWLWLSLAARDDGRLRRRVAAAAPPG